MDTLQSIYARRSIKLFDSSHTLPEDIYQKLIEAARQAPSSYNLQHTRLVDVRDQKTKEAISKAAYDQPQILSASLLFIVTADTKAWTKNPERCWQNAPQAVQDFILKSIPPFHKARPYIERDEAIRSGALTAMTLMLAAKGLGYDSCPMIGFEEPKVRELIRLPDDHVVVMLLPIGIGIKPPLSKPGFIPLKEFLHIDFFPND